jgi:hypothetical protein
MKVASVSPGQREQTPCFCFNVFNKMNKCLPKGRRVMKKPTDGFWGWNRPTLAYILDSYMMMMIIIIMIMIDVYCFRNHVKWTYVTSRLRLLWIGIISFWEKLRCTDTSLGRSAGEPRNLCHIYIDSFPSSKRTPSRQTTVLRCEVLNPCTPLYKHRSLSLINFIVTIRR